MNKYKKLFGNSILFTIGNLGSKLISILMVPLYTYQLSTSQYGTIDVMLTTVNLLVPILTLELGQAAIRFSIESKTEDEKLDIYYNILLYSILLGIVILMIYPILYIFKVFGTYGFLFIIVLILTQFNTIFSQFVRGSGYVRVFALNGIIQTAVIVLSNVLFLVFLNFKIEGYLYSLILGNIASMIYLFFGSKGYRLLRRKNYISTSLIKKMVSYSIPLIPNTTMWWLINGATRYFILFFINSSANGIYAVASKIPSILSMVGNIFIQAWQLSAFEEFKSNDRDAFNSAIFNFYYIILFFISSLILVVLIPLMDMIVSYDFFEGWKLVPLLLLGVIYQSLSGFLGVNYTASKQTKGAFTTSIYGGVASLISNLVFLPLFGLFGASVSSAFSFFIMFVIRLKDTRKYTIISVDWSKFILTNLIYILQIIFLFVSDGLIQLFIETSLFLCLISIHLQRITAIMKAFFRKK